VAPIPVDRARIEEAAMKMRAIGFVAAALAVAGWLQAAALQEVKKPAPGTAPDQTTPVARTTPFHKYLVGQVGTWDAAVKAMMPGAPPSESKGTETIAMSSDLWQVSDFKGEFGGMPFTGHCVTGYDSAKQKYVAVWVDSMTDKLTLMEGTTDPSGKILTLTYEQADPATGQTMKYRNVHEMKDDDTRLFTMTQAGADGKEVAVMSIVYKRHKQ
jgi:hypothetical protein